MKILIAGSGGREHALAWKLAQSPEVDHLFCAPGNAGIAGIADCRDVNAEDVEGLVRLAKECGADLTIIGPEAPLALGVIDRFHEEGLRAFGPTRAGARVESSKAFAKQLMRDEGIPSAEYAEFGDAEEALAYVRDRGAPLVVKADGLASGKGVTVANTVEEAEDAVRAAMVEKRFGDAGDRVVIEEKLEGEEASILALTDGEHLLVMDSSQDHKPLREGDTGPNTGGMGAYSPAPVVDWRAMQTIRERILEPCIAGLAKRGEPYTGVLYAGLMMTANGPKVVEFNCRFGDPETQALLPRLKTDLAPVLAACCDGTLDQHTLEWEDSFCVSVALVSGGYPGGYEKGAVIEGITAAEEGGGAVVFHAGTKLENGNIVTNGGRVLNVTCSGPSIVAAIENAYAAVKKIRFDHMYYRSDIGQKARRHFS